MQLESLGLGVLNGIVMALLDSLFALPLSHSDALLLNHGFGHNLLFPRLGVGLHLVRPLLLLILFSVLPLLELVFLSLLFFGHIPSFFGSELRFVLHFLDLGISLLLKDYVVLFKFLGLISCLLGLFFLLLSKLLLFIRELLLPLEHLIFFGLSHLLSPFSFVGLLGE